MPERRKRGGLSLGHVPGERWAFDAKVAACFSDMLERSIPGYVEMRRTTHAMALRFLGHPGDQTVLDIGCSDGGSLASLVASDTVAPGRFVGLEISPPMLDAARKRFARNPNVDLLAWDLRTGLPDLSTAPPVRLILSVLTLQFTPIEYRQHLVAEVFDLLAPGGAFLLVEKTLGAGRIDDHLVAAYLEHKRASGYSDEEIRRKRLSLEGVLVPVTAAWNEQMLHGAGFSDVDCYWRMLNFSAWVAVKSR